MYLPKNSLSRALSYFDHSSNRWVAIPLRNAHDTITQKFPSPPRDAQAVSKQTLSLTSWNIQASYYKPVERCELILDHISKGPKAPDIIFFQEVMPRVREALLSNPTVRSDFLTTDAEDDTSFRKVPFTTMTLLSNRRFGSPLLAEGEGADTKGGRKVMLDSVFRAELPTRYRRDALCVNIASPTVPGTILRLLNVHLDSVPSRFRRVLQMSELASSLREPGCSGGIIAGDFNAIHSSDYKLVEKNNLVDAWVALHGGTTEPYGGATWGIDVELEGGRKSSRLDKVAMLGIQPNEIEVLQPGRLNAFTPWSDHCGLRCTFTI